jgi:hypothetical protein
MAVHALLPGPSGMASCPGSVLYLGLGTGWGSLQAQAPETGAGAVRCPPVTSTASGAPREGDWTLPAPVLINYRRSGPASVSSRGGVFGTS